uniref:Procollagen-proline, 2-oxoglutarate 4-dioxygenase (proline 4-hydroxylase), alpha II polypeptide n=1 Tax=Mus musculus TaxID=10090 RepID=D6RCG8_MOUSE
MKLQVLVLVLLMSWFGVLSWVQAEFFTSIGDPDEHASWEAAF